MKGDTYNQVKHLKLNGVPVEHITLEQAKEVASARMNNNSTAYNAMGALIWRLTDELEQLNQKI